MYKYLILLLLTLQSCNAQNNTKVDKHLVDTKEFSEGIEKSQSLQLLDVRTPGEFSQGHIPNAVNYDWLGNKFDEQTKDLDKTQPVYLYCQSGGRSASAAKKLVSEGFEVYELKGGMMNWRSQNMPESSDVVSSKGMSMKDYTDSLQGEKLVLVDFYADWCAPCMKMKPFLDKIAVDMSQEVKVLRVDVETHKSLANELKISAIPILRLYKNNSMVWEQNGFIGEKELREAINKLK
jgi:thioredoxin 1